MLFAQKNGIKDLKQMWEENKYRIGDQVRREPVKKVSALKSIKESTSSYGD